MEYNEDGRGSVRKFYDVDGNVSDKCKYKYDKHGKGTLLEYYDADGELTETIEYEDYRVIYLPE